MTSGNTLCILAITILSLIASPVFAQDTVTYGRVAGMAGAGSANPHDNTAITLNPATLGLSTRYEIQGHLDLNAHLDTSLAVSITDSKTALVALGLSYQRSRTTGGGDSREWPGWVDTNSEFARRKRFDAVTLAIAYPLLDKKLSLGLNGTVAKYNHDVQGKGVTGNLDFGVSTQPVDGVSFGLVGRNLLPVSGCDSNSRPCIPDFDMGILFGTYLGLDDLGAIALDLDFHLSGPTDGPPISVRAGLEKRIGSVLLETGYRWEGPVRQKWFSFGIGASQKNTGLHYSIDFPLHTKPFDAAAITHMFAFRVMGAGGIVGDTPSGF